MANVTVEDINRVDLTARAERLRNAYFDAIPEVCPERSKLVTDYHKVNNLFADGRVSVLEKAKAYRYYLQNRSIPVWHGEARDKGGREFKIGEVSLFAGSTTSKFKGVLIYPELLGLSLWPELETISDREQNPNFLSKKDAKVFNEVFPFWLDNTILELARRHYQPWDTDKQVENGPDFGLLQYLVFFLASKPECISHTIPDFTQALDIGLDGIRKKAESNRTDPSLTEDERDFFLAVETVSEAISEYSEKIAGNAEQMIARPPGWLKDLEKNNRDWRAELEEIAAIYRRVPRHPASTFREALTTVWICWTALHLENANVGLSLGRLDQILYPYYKKDVENGTLSAWEAVELVCCLWLKIGDHVPFIPEAGEQLFGGTGSNQAITIGGVDKDGNDAVNDLTHVMLRATELMMLRDPNLNARYYEGVNPPDYLTRISEANLNTCATPAIHNDKVVIQALESKGDAPEHARDYGVIGCVEPGSNGRHYGMSAAILFNLIAALELTMGNGKHRHTGDKLISKETGDPASFKTFDEFKGAFEKQLGWLVDESVKVNEALGRTHQQFYPTPILSTLFEGPMEKKKDVIFGGAVINSSGAAIIGLADVADCLSAIQSEVFDNKTTSFGELMKAVNSNFEGYDVLHARLVNPEKTPKFGTENETAEENALWLAGLLDKMFQAKVNYRGGRYRVGYWTMTNHAGFGRLTKATPNGRKDRENFSSGITPVSGATPELTPALNSVANLPGNGITNGMALNIKYTPRPGEKEKMTKDFAEAVQGYFAKGGMEIQFNVTDRETFLKAVDHPDDYDKLLVRVSGYTAYFKDLNPQMQKEIIERTEYDLFTGEAKSYPPYDLPK